MDLELIRKHYEELSTSEMLRELLQNAGSFQPAALEVIQAVLESRRGGLTALIKEQADITGEEIGRIGSIKSFIGQKRYLGGAQHRQRVDPAHGTLILTEHGIGFLALERDSSISKMALVLAGPFSYAIEKAKQNALPGPVSADLHQLPISLIAEIDVHSAWFPHSSIKQLTLHKRQLSITGEYAAHCNVPDDAHDLLMKWADTIDVVLSQQAPKRSVGLWKRLFGSGG